MRKRQIAAFLLAAALVSVQPMTAMADTQISLTGPSGESNNSTNSGTNPSGDGQNNQNTLPMAGTGAPGSNHSTNSNTNTGTNPNSNSNTQSPSGGSNSGEITSQGPGSQGQGTQTGSNSSGSTTGGTGTSSPAGNSGTSTVTKRDGLTPQTALLYYTTSSQGSSGTLTQPTVQSEGAYLYNATTGETLLSKNAEKSFYPASITKLMTALLVLEHCKLDDVVTYRASSAYQLESGAVKLNLAEGDTLTVRDSLYALLLKSANDVAVGLAEHVAGSQEAFAKMMNERAKALGCTNTNFVNPNGLNDTNHYTTPHDMALIAAEAFKNTTLCEINSTLSYVLPATKSVNTTRTLALGHKMFYPNDSRYYEGIIGGKTGYTSKAGNTLVTCVEREGTRLIAVILKSSQSHYQDTKAMLDYGFESVKQKQVGSGTAAYGTWKQNEYGWYFLNENNTFVKSIWMEIDGQVYLFDADGYMVKGWRRVNNSNWYYFGGSGAMKKACWVQTNNDWYYVQEDGSLLTNGVTPDGYTVDEFGIWRQN
ncbi:MAG: serine hydrolase [bacterium]|nr:serine hydrolase [bacterium]